jgi:NADP-dependent 3-hydroxy acid dehydrogenase YdfG
MKITLKPLVEQVILLTGASSGIGLVTAKLAASRGAKVMLVARSEDALADAVREIEAAGGQAAYAVADVGDAGQVRAAAAAAVARFGRIDTWVNNAGVAIYAKLAETPLDEHERMFRTNYFGVVNGATAALSHPLPDHGGLCRYETCGEGLYRIAADRTGGGWAADIGHAGETGRDRHADRAARG